MRRIVLAAAIALLPVLAHSQTSTAIGAQTEQPATTLQARLTPPAAPLRAAAAQPAVALIAAMPSKVHSTVHIKINRLLPQESAGSLSYTLLTDTTVPTESTLPVLVHVSSVDVDHLDAREAVSINMTIGTNGIPSNLELNRATNKEIADRVATAVSQYRFKPATVNNLNVVSNVTVDVTLDK